MKKKKTELDAWFLFIEKLEAFLRITLKTKRT